MRPPGVLSYTKFLSKFPFDQRCVRFKYAVLNTTFLAQKLNIPAKPKRPLTVYLRYQKDQLQSVVAKHPNLTVPERAKIIGKMWNSLDAANKEKYFKSFASDNNVYRQQLAEYYQKITQADMRRLHAKRMELKEEIAERERSSLQRRKLASLGRPTRPLTGYMKFFTTSKDRKPNENHKDFIRRKADEWHKLSDKQQAAYNVSAKDMNKYK